MGGAEAARHGYAEAGPENKLWLPGQEATVLLLAGDSGTGKSTLVKGLEQALGSIRIVAICVDDYHRYDRKERKDLPFTPLSPDCNYIEAMEQHLRLLVAGEGILKPIYNHKDGTLDRPEWIDPKEFVVIEGLLPLYNKALRASGDVTAYLDPDPRARLQWKFARDMGKRGYTREEVEADLLKRAPESKKYIHPQRGKANIVISFAPIEERGETVDGPLSATIYLRPHTELDHPQLENLLADLSSRAIHLDQRRDPDTGRPEDALHIHSYASEADTRLVAEALWDQLNKSLSGNSSIIPLPESLGIIETPTGTYRSGPLALSQLILLFYMMQARHNK